MAERFEDAKFHIKMINLRIILFFFAFEEDTDFFNKNKGILNSAPHSLRKDMWPYLKLNYIIYNLTLKWFTLYLKLKKKTTNEE